MSRLPDNEPARVSLCANLCETASPRATADELEAMLATTCSDAGFPYCERIYVGSYFCENYFLGLNDAFHESVCELRRRHDLGATLVVPIIGQAFLARAWLRIPDVITRFADIYDEVVVNDVAMFHDLQRWFAGEGLPSIRQTAERPQADTQNAKSPNTIEYEATAAEGDEAGLHGFWRAHRAPRLGLGRLFSKGLRDARYPELRDRASQPELSAEASMCLGLLAKSATDAPAPLVEVDPMSTVVDVSKLIDDIGNCIEPTHQPNATEIAIHLPYCYATTGRNCGPASIDEPDSEKFRLGRGCSRHCLRINQGYLTDEGARYLKHGRTYYYENPTCQIAGTDSWRIIYAADIIKGDSPLL